MLSDLINFLRSCFRPSSNCHVHTGPGADSTGRQDGLLWYKDVGPHMSGEFSMAVVQANNLLEDQSQLESGCLGSHESGPYGTFVGVYDGHGGPETARYVNNHLFQHLKRFASEQENISMEVVIKKAYQATEEGFTSIVTKQWPTSPQIAAVGSCCLVGVICGGTLYIANAGDSRAVLGRAVKETGEVLSIQLSTEHNASIESVRQELHALHPDDPQIVVLKNVWRVKGLIQISRSIGDLYLKKPEFNREPLFAKFRLREPFKRPILSSEPSVSTIQLHQHDRFIIFASDGLWEQLTNQEAVSIVQKHPHNGSAKRLVKAALKEAAKKREMRYSDLKKIDRRVRRHFHDDITVIVLFFDSDGVFKATSSLKGGPNISVKGGVNLPHKTLAPSS